MVNSVVLLIVVVVIVLGILLSFGLFFLLRNSDTEQTSNVLASGLTPISLPFASCQTSSQCLTSQICSNGRCTNVVDAMQNNLAATSVSPPPIVVVNRVEERTSSLPPPPPSSVVQEEIENLERLLERQNGDLRSLQVTLERHMESNQNKLSNLENTIISKGAIRDLPPPPSVRRNMVRDLPPPPTYVEEEEEITQATTTASEPVVQQPTVVTTSRTIEQPIFNLPTRRSATVAQTQPVATAPVVQTPVQRPVVLSGATVNPTLNAQPVPVTAPSTIVLGGNTNPIRTNNNTSRRNPYSVSDDPFDQFAQQDLPPPAILQTKPTKQEKNCNKRDVSCPLVPAEVPKCKKNKDRKSVVWQL